MASEESTLIALKANFIRAQVRILSQPLVPSAKWKASSEIPEKELEEVMKQANKIVRRHNNTVYDRIALRNAAKQIETLYWQDAAPDLSDEDDEYGDEDDEPLTAGDDLTTDSNISKLSSMEQEEDLPEELAASITKLQELQRRREAAKGRLEQLRRLNELIAPLKDPSSKVQPNLVTKDGALAVELAKSKTLGIRVSAGVVGLRGNREEEIDDDGDVDMIDERERVRRVWDGI